ncbi:YkgJ family cysteine cluster protein [Myxococcus stipitatus]|uniref:YkgJ family cysteine cluster protein n=1 Tax=Myxococcus stipitatus TaxID=83455 RepID=UPI001F412C30|nr:YkgJ family cysteine cluster protein [Myxococcus stipitatus]MCE9671984.1 YkgJ family cysteine cluster protein [Myxococcus stipitatus]
MECTRCGACCVAPDIAALDKPLGLRCPHLGEDNLCTMYERRPAICRDYQPDEVCRLIEAPTLEERVHKYLALFDLTAEARAVKERACPSMKLARKLAPPPSPTGGGRRE